MATPRLATALFALLACAATQARAADASRTSLGDRLYVGVTAASLQFEDEQDAMRFNDSSSALGVFAGLMLKERLALEVSYDSFDAVDLHDVAGSGIARLDVATQRSTLVLGVLSEVSLKEIFEWRRDWRLFGTLGLYNSEVDRTITLRGSGTSASVADDITGLVLGAGVLYAIGRMELRGYVRSFGVLADGEAREAGAAVQLRF